MGSGDSNAWRRNIQARSFTFATRILRLVGASPRSVEGQVGGRQLARGGTSVGANVEEAQAAHSRRDFLHKISIARKEARGAHYWLRLVAATGLLPTPRMQPLLDEADGIVRILSSIVRSVRQNDEHRADGASRVSEL